MMKKAFLEITNCCNLSCSFCHQTSRQPKSLTYREFDELTDRLVGECEYLYFHLMGEPFLHPLLPAFVSRAREKGFRPMLTTNGTLLPARGAALYEDPPFKVSISLHAPEANGAFATEDYLDGCIRFAREISSRGTILVFRLWNLGGKNAGNSELLTKLHDAFPGEWKEIRSGCRMAERVFLEWGQQFDWPDLTAPEKSGDFFCYGLRDQIGILVDGTVIPCCLDADGVLALGNLFDKPLREILRSERARTLYDGFTKHHAVEPFCRRCGYAAVTKRYRCDES